MKRINYFINNVYNVSKKLDLSKDIKRIKINLLSPKELKDFAKKIPKYNDIEKIKEIENETGIILKYHVHEKNNVFYEFSKFGMSPLSVKMIKENNEWKPDKDIQYLENFDILVVDKKSKINDDEIKWD